MKKNNPIGALKNEQRKTKRDSIVDGLQKKIELSKKKEKLIEAIEYLKPVPNSASLEENGYKSLVKTCNKITKQYDGFQSAKEKQLKAIESKYKEKLAAAKSKEELLQEKKKASSTDLDKYEKKMAAIKEAEVNLVEKKEKAIAKTLAKCEKNIEELNLHFTALKEKKIYHLKLQASKCDHKIKVENELYLWDILPDDEKKETLTSVSFYRPDVFGYWMILLAIVFEIIYIVMGLSVMPRDFLVGVMIMFNIVTLLLLFTCAIKVKAYVKKFSVVAIVFGAYNVLRLSVVVPFILKINYSQIAAKTATMLIICQVAMAVILCAAGISSFMKTKRKQKYVEEGKITKNQMSR